MLCSTVLSAPAVRAADASALPKVVNISAGAGHVLAVGADGTLWAWGDNSSGELGDGSFISRSAPVQVGAEKNWVSVAAGDTLSAAIKKDGSLWMWGTNVRNKYIAWQDPALVDRSTPLRYGKDNNWAMISAGGGGLAAIRKDGTLWQFGVNVLQGTIGNGKLNSDKDWADVSVGSDGLLALKKDGSLWGMGNIVPTDYNTGKLVRIGSEHDFDQIAASYYSVVRKKDGSVWRLSKDQNSESIGFELLSEMNQVVSLTGEFVSGMVRGDGSFWKWNTGLDQYDQYNCPVKLTDADEGGNFGVALDENGGVWTYGTNTWGQRGNGLSDSAYTPLPYENPLVEETTPDAAAPVNSILDQVFTDWRTYTLKGDGSLWLSDEIHEIHNQQLGSDRDWSSITGSREELYALKRDGSLWSYRYGDQAPSGLGRSAAYEFEPLMAGSTWKMIAPSDLGFTVGLRTDGTLWFWGKDSWQKINKGAPSVAVNAPLQLSQNRDWRSVSVFNSSILAVKNNGTLWGLGDNSRGQLGIATKYSAGVTAFTRIGNTADWVQAEAGEYASVGLKKDGSLWQWGSSMAGNGVGSSSATPVIISSVKSWTKIWNAGYRAYALQNNGQLYAWGDNSYGQLGNGSAKVQSVPTRVSGTGSWKDIFTSSTYTTGIQTDGSVWNWGNDGSDLSRSGSKYGNQLTPIQ
ncbi:hypothetical protein [Paenibacillus sp. MMS20-IR301]|uniref:RCC1 domain-containing protein n=1 Tax=Paenibacillus sp. MMS20-IR301 TaxID=2895946 RepID=UPI0028E8F602|nr:hypothetical protein [Paenibacillus sp. MMS20-IR301]WNS45356.1 hypothetical protein LOS79_08815 [Paenibacillus sp. MMS20-IR301]